MSDLEQLIRNIVRDEIAKAVADDGHSRRHSEPGNGSPGHEDTECSQESMDRTSTDNDGASPYELAGRQHIRRLIASIKPSNGSQVPATRRKASRSNTP